MNPILRRYRNSLLDIKGASNNRLYQHAVQQLSTEFWVALMERHSDEAMLRHADRIAEIKHAVTEEVGRK